MAPATEVLTAPTIHEGELTPPSLHPHGLDDELASVPSEELQHVIDRMRTIIDGSHDVPFSRALLAEEILYTRRIIDVALTRGDITKKVHDILHHNLRRAILGKKKTKSSVA